ncbi:MAG: hypothetical protein ABJZ55_17235 [Fuerstiella sp.]
MSTSSKSMPSESPQAQSREQSRADKTDPSRALRVCVIGDVDRQEFASVQQLIARDNRLQLFRRFNDIQEAILEPDVVQQAELTIVLQSWSEQFARRDIHHLIGLTFANRLICFCGPWCESDGRNHDLWPDAIRVPARDTLAYWNDVYQDIVSQQEALPPTAAKDEVFANRTPRRLSSSILDTLTSTNAAVIGPDSSLRRTMANLLKSLSIKTAVRGLISVVPYQTIVPVQTPRGPIHVVFHDLDPYGPLVQQSLEACEKMFPDAKLVGVANMPDAGLVSEIADVNLDAVLAKSNLLADMQHWLTQQPLSSNH